ncbi:MAG: outer membrane beta-barrel protein [Acidobacteriota bacterium]
MKTNITLALALLCAATASAQTYEISASGGYNYIWKNSLGSLNATEVAKANDSQLKPGTAFGARLTYNTTGYYGFELTYLNTNAKFNSNVQYSDGTFVNESGKARVQLAAFNFLIYMMPNREKWRPYITAGLTGAQFGAPRIPTWIGGGARSYGGNFGGGIKLFPHKNFFVRADLRDYITGKPYDLTYPDPLPGQSIQSGGILHMIEGTVGVGITF